MGLKSKCAFVLVGCLLLAGKGIADDRPNIVVIMGDDMGYSDIGCYGSEIQTPVLDRLAAGGVRFTQFYNTARCCPTRAALLTGVYQHQAGIGLMVGDQGLPGYRGELGRDVMSIAEVLRGGGYRTFMSGKWHVTRFTKPEGPKDNWPMGRGFDKFYGTITGAGSFYDPATLCRGEQYVTPVNDEAYQPDVYYYTDAISDNAVSFLREHDEAGAVEPVFLYVAYTSAHWPLHALPEDIAKYEGVYDEGFEPVRAARYAKLKSLGVIDEKVKLSETSHDWASMKAKAWEVRNMQVYAAMVDRMDQGIGKIVDELERQGELDNTLILYLQDNGGCAEGYGRGEPRKPYATDLKPMGRDEFQTKIWTPMQTRDGRPVRTGPTVMAGAEDTFIAYGGGWANVSNTPFREYKHYVHEGGVSSPLVAWWPAGMSARVKGGLAREPSHVIDVMATCVDVAGVEYPKEFGGQAIIGLEGVSLRSAFEGKGIERDDALYFEHHLNSAIRDGDWKLVRKGKSGKNAEVYAWELYDMANDRSETQDLAGRYPDRVELLKAKWEAWALRANVKPFPWEVKGD